nr:hypothetical protein [Tanacetum cinerariifolium]
MNEEDMFGVNDIDGNEVIVDVTAGENVEQDATIAKKKVSTATGKVVTTAEDVEIDADEDLSLIDETAQDQGRMNEEDMFRVNDIDGNEVIVDVTTGENVEQDATIAKKEVSTATGKVVTTAEDVEKDQIAFDEEVARKLDAHMKAKMEEEERIAKKKDEENIALIEECDDVQPTIDADKQSKRAGDEIEQESAKRQRLEKEDDTTELKRCLEIVPKDDDDVTIKATPLSSKSPTIVDYKIYKEGKKSYFKIIKAYGNSQNYLNFRKMFKKFNEEDLEVLRSIVKTRFEKTKPVNDMDNLLFQTLKTMFEHRVEDNIWKYQQGTIKVHNWKLFDSCGVYCVTT